MTQPLQPDSFLDMLVSLIHEHTGLQYEPHRQDVLLDRLRPLLAERNCNTFMDYYYLLKYDSRADQEWLRLQTALAVNETYFWREVDQIQAAARTLVPRLQAERPGQPIRIWHAACATGEEPYTMAIALTEAGRYNHGPIEIVATDFNQAAIQQAQSGIFRKRSFRALPAELKQHYFHPENSGDGSAFPELSERYQIDPAILERVQFRYLNLLDPSGMETMLGFDIIFCRNVFIYFSGDAIRSVINHFHRALNWPGYLFVAAAESLLRYTNLFELVEIDSAFAYRKEKAIQFATGKTQ